MVEQTYHAKIGDVVEVGAHRVHEPARVGEILEVLGEPDHSHFRVRWDDGRETSTTPPATQSSVPLDEAGRGEDDRQ